ncbi:MAG: 2OG-Fe(II) oxygenase [Verrucomicrobiota bacterium]
MIKSLFSSGKEQFKREFWNAKPFPHAIIDDFLDNESFRSLTESLRAVHENPSISFKTPLEKKNTTYSSETFSKECGSLVGAITGKEFLGELSELTGVREITPLTEYKGHDFKFYHKMEEGGFLASHVDHSEVLGNNKVHFLNCIYYGPERWENGWGGETVLFDKWGFREVAKVACKPNRLLIFLHTSQSFHGVSRLVKNETSRFTIYMDFYANVAELGNMAEASKAAQSNFVPRFWKHRTTFVPLTVKYMHRYLPWYLLWLTRQKY